MRQRSLAAEVKANVVAVVKEHYPDFFKHFRWRTANWSTGGSVEVRWVDGPSRDEVQALLAPLKEQNSIISISPERHFTELFLTRIAKEVCTREGWDLPKIKCIEGQASIDTLCLNHIYTGIYREAYKTSALEEKKGNE